MQVNKYAELLDKLENEELEQTGLGADVYTQLLALYLYENKLPYAKMLWMRIAGNLKSESKELAQLNLLNVAMQNNNYPDFFAHIKYEWSENISPIITDLLEKQREELFTLLGSAYASIYERDLLRITQMSPEELKVTCTALNWTYEQNGDDLIVLPKPKEPVPRPIHDDQLLKLTEFVSFLEN